ncbi:MAG: response regulator transcription factor [Bacteroidia bacterium]|nr:response regulator transcription factor [Bacteroidia bacterium]
MTIGIIDDETNNRLLINNMIQAFAPNEQVVVIEGLISNAIEKLNKHKPDLIFLDIELRNGTGFDILKKLDYKPEIIFTTAYSQYAIDAIKIHAFDYILKPINENELIRSLNDCKDKLEGRKIGDTENRPVINDAFFNIATNEGKISLNYNDIFYFESSGAYTFCVVRDKKLLFSKNIGEVEKEVPKEIFFRTHNSYIVNLGKISKVEIKRNGNIWLANNDIIPLSQRKIKIFKVLINKKLTT